MVTGATDCTEWQKRQGWFCALPESIAYISCFFVGFNISKFPWSAIRRTNNAAVFLSCNHKTLNTTFKTNRLSSHSAGQQRWSRLCATAHINNTMVHSIVPFPPPPRFFFFPLPAVSRVLITVFMPACVMPSKNIAFLGAIMQKTDKCYCRARGTSRSESVNHLIPIQPGK